MSAEDVPAPTLGGDGAERAIDPDTLSPEVRGALERLSTGLLDILARIERHEAERRDDQRQRRRRSPQPAAQPAGSPTLTLVVREDPHHGPCQQ